MLRRLKLALRTLHSPSMTTVPLCHRYEAHELRGASKTAAEMKAGGFSLSELKAAGFTLEKLKAAGYVNDELKAAGFTIPEDPPPA